MEKRVLYVLLLVMSLAFLGGCGGGDGGSGPGTGTVSMDIADAKPSIEGGQPNELWVVFDDVQVHSSGGGWVSLKLPETPFEINLLAFSDGLKTQLATPSQIPAGHVTQIRFVISRAYMVFYGNPPNPDETVEIDLDVPSGTLKTDQQIDWDLQAGGAMSLTVHFDLSQSIVQSGQKYKLKPVLHLFNNEPEEAATICGTIDANSFGNASEADVKVILNGSDGRDEPYTDITVEKDPQAQTTGFCIYWLVPLENNEAYTVEMYNSETSEPFYTEVVNYPDLGPGVTLDLHGGTAIPPLTQ